MKQLERILIGTLLVSSMASQAQKSPLNLPEVWMNVRYNTAEHMFMDEDRAPQPDYTLIKATKPGKGGGLWRVFTDRENVALFDAPEGKETRRLPKLSTRLYVYKEKGPWVLVSEESTGPAQHWCHKRDLVLWNTPLGDHATGIELKAFVVNTTKAGRALVQDPSKKERYEVLAAPSAKATKIKEQFIYDVLFVYKEYVDPSSGDAYFLVSDEIQISGGEGLGLLGWIHGSRVKTWETRLCLEPNFDPAAIAERREKNIRAKLFLQGDKAGLERYLQDGTGRGVADNTARDPAMGLDPERYPRIDGKLFRYPVLLASNTGMGPDNCRFLTGVSGYFTPSSSGQLEEYAPERYHELDQVRQRRKERMNDVNLVFVLDGGLGTEQFRAAATTVVDKLARAGSTMSIEYSAVIYRNEFADMNEAADPENNYCETIGPLSNAGQFGARLASVVPRNSGDPSGQRAVHFALKRAIGFCQDNETNIIVHIGARPDVLAGNPFFVSAKANGGTRVEPTDVSDLLSINKPVHYLGYVGWDDPAKVPQRERERLYEGLEEMMQNMANRIKNSFGGGMSMAETGRDVESARAVETRQGGLSVIRMDHMGSWLMKTTMLPDKNSNNTLAASIRLNIDSCLLLAQKLVTELDQLFQNDSPLSERAGDLTNSAAMDVLLDGIDPSEHDAVRAILSKEKVHMFVDSRTVYKAGGLTHPIFRYVLFYEESKLNDQLRDLTDLNQKLDAGDPAMVAMAFREYWMKKAEGVLGSGYTKATIKVEDLLERLHGIQDLSGMVKPFARTEIFGDLTVQDIENGKRPAPDQMRKYQQLVQQSVKELTSLRDQKYYYEAPEGHNKFYWVPIEYVFN